MVQAEILMNVRHRNVVSLIGYCDEVDSVELVYEYLPKGSLEQQLSCVPQLNPVDSSSPSPSQRLFNGHVKSSQKSNRQSGFPFNLLLQIIHAQGQAGFISIDCGLPEANYSSYIPETGDIKYVPDNNFIDTGDDFWVDENYISGHHRPYKSLRSFPDGVRNCYRISVTRGTKYLIRASFLYGNYDGKNKLPEFELHLGPNLWDSLRLEDVDKTMHKELIHVPLQNYVHICLVSTNSGVPFISALELRPLRMVSYQAVLNGSLALIMRCDTGQGLNPRTYRYPDDIHDRFWYPCNDHDDWTQLNASYRIDYSSQNNYRPAAVVMSTAATPTNDDSLISFWPTDQPEAVDDGAQYYVFMHFAEVEILRANESRWQYITRNGRPFYQSFAPYSSTITIFNTNPLNGGINNFSIIKAENSTFPPILNAFEIYRAKPFLLADTNQEDVDAIASIKLAYKITKNWQGDPCAPPGYSWVGLKCSSNENESPRIISLDLSSSGLTGEIAPSISDLPRLQTLDLSNNNLTGPIPDFLFQLKNLSVLNLETNQLSGSVPTGIIEKGNNGYLSLRLCENPNLNGNFACTKKKQKKSNVLIPLVASIAGVLVLLLTIPAIGWCCCQRKRKHRSDVTAAKRAIQFGSSESTKRKFTYFEILKFTNNFERVLGKGGFGTVYHGYIDRNQVAIKMLSPSSVQGFQQFNAEVNILMRVHHRNLTILVGYCDDETSLALVYEYMANGNLHQHLSDSTPRILTWEDRLRIARDSAQGLEYLHCGCKPPIMHRDVKSTNILLNENLQAKLSDFGLSRNFPTNDATHASSLLAGTPGYLDPESFLSNRLNEKSDVYSFGVVLLEIITGRPVIWRTQERIHISQWVGYMLANGDINSIVDPKLEGNFNTNSVWKAVELAMACVSTNANKRPSMSQVVVDLKECLATEHTDRTGQSHETESNVLMASNSIALLTPSAR